MLLNSEQGQSFKSKVLVIIDFIVRRLYGTSLTGAMDFSIPGNRKIQMVAVLDWPIAILQHKFLIK